MSHDDSNLSIRPIFHSFQQSGEELHPPVSHPGEPLIETPKQTPTQASAPNPFQTPDQVVQPPSIPTHPSTPPRRLNPTRTRCTSRLLTAHIRHFREPTESTTDPDVIRSTTEREIDFQSVQPVTDLEDIQRLLDLLYQCSRRRFIVQALLGNPVEPIRTDSSPLNVQPTTSTPSGSSTRRQIRYLPRLLVSTSTSPLFTRSISARISVRLSTLSSLNT